ncbi:MAG: hypothetical protein J5881_04120 [Clostridia bacterium]|nr:hypothetical protein [Clostridia bacterium]
MSREFSAEQKLFNLRNRLEFIRTSNVPANREEKRKHEFLVSKAFSYLCELDAVEDYLEAMYVDSFTIASHHQLDALMAKHPHVFYHCGRFIKIVEIIVESKHHLFVALTPVSQI